MSATAVGTVDTSLENARPQVSLQTPSITPVKTEHQNEPEHELRLTASNRSKAVDHSATSGRSSTASESQQAELGQEIGSPARPVSQGVPSELRNAFSEFVFVLICSMSQLLFAILLGDIVVNQQQFKNTLGLQSSELPWITGSMSVANGLSVILSGS